ncbi:hypothetical protein VPJ68_00355, partial [Parabacteroides distasonis]
MEQSFLLLAVIVFFPMLGAGVSFLTGRKDKVLRDRVAGCITIAEFLLLVLLLAVKGAGTASLVIPGICGMGLSFETEGFRAVYGTIAAFMWMATTLFSAEYF